MTQQDRVTCKGLPEEQRITFVILDPKQRKDFIKFDKPIKDVCVALGEKEIPKFVDMNQKDKAACMELEAGQRSTFVVIPQENRA